MDGKSAHQTKNATPKPAISLSQPGILQRTCACGGVAGLTGECEECSSKRLSGQRNINLPNEQPTESTQRSPLGRYNFGQLAIQPKERLGIQTKLAIGQPGDKYEQEADRVAEQVMRMPEPKIKGVYTRHEEKLQRQSMEEEEDEEKTKQLQMKSMSGASSEASPELQARITNLQQGGGEPLSVSERAFLEPRFGQDFSAVRIHRDTQASEMAKSLNARAFTIGRDVVFGAGQYQPRSSEGQRLLAHELTHVVQQNSQFALPPSNVSTNTPNNSGDNNILAVPTTKTPVQNKPTIRQKSSKTIQREALFSSTMEICRRLLESRVFHVSQGGLIVSANATWEGSSQWEGSEPPRCGNEVYNMTLEQEGLLFDSGYGTCEFRMGSPFSRTWTNLPEGDYYLTIWTNNTNPNCCLRGDITVSQQSGLSGESCTQPPPGPLEILHTALDLAGLIPALGAIPDTINAGIYLIEGDWIDAGLSAVSIIPLFGDTASVARIGTRTAVSVTGESVERVGRDRIATGLREARAERRSVSEATEELPGTTRPRGRARIPGLPRCRTGSLYCPIDFLREEFNDLFQSRRTSEFASYVRELPDADLNLGRSLRREQTILTGNAMYAQYLREVSPSQWSEPFREALAGRSYREIVVEGRRYRWPLDDLDAPWVVHHDPPLGWVQAESNQWWHPMPYRIHNAVHQWWHNLERRIKSRIPRDMRREILEGDFDIRDFGD